ncbi:MAG TPA: hypothetical protein VF054_10680 [Micromonosporaceae bacterium]
MSQPTDLATDPVRPWTRPAVLVPVFAVLALVGGFFPSFSIEANLYMIALGGVFAWLGLSGRVPRRPPAPVGRGAAWWLVPALLLAGVELVDFLLGSTDAHPTLSLLADPVLDRYVARAAGYFGWLTVFWGLVRR